ncbi:N-acetylmuramoyl-L-alanine amidase [Xenopus laevis]|uniref:N-acetylmuramoyl-L-alanine amidase n=1 Tax=Xenopus laevis TaxID=8355 RepID=A0A8J0US95_XENLA|nr:N-acetylmuramoyl-L-alanine amidase [Xenopus laevis]
MPMMQLLDQQVKPVSGSAEPRTEEGQRNQEMDSVLLILLCALCAKAGTVSNAPVKMEMDTFLSLVKDLESSFPELSARSLSKLMLSTVTVPSHCTSFSKDQTNLTQTLLTYKVVEMEDSKFQEQGVVLAPDGSTVALRPLLQAFVWGWKAGTDCEQVESKYKSPDSNSQGAHSEDSGYTYEKRNQKDLCAQWLHSNQNNDSIHSSSLTISLGLAFLDTNVALDKHLVAVDGCWDSISDPRTFQLQNPPCHSGLTMAFLNGVLDGTLLGELLKQDPKEQNLSSLLLGFYWGNASSSPYRRQDFQAIISGHSLERLIQRAIHCYREMEAGHGLHNINEEQIKIAAGTAAREFEQHFLDCPAVIPRCMWGAKPYNGKPTFLRLPLSHVFIHHTYEPSQPCTSFSECAANMRSMQNFHQQDRSWDDIGYSYVVGSNGYLYEGRGWNWVGAHTRGHNTFAYGVSFIGDYTSKVPKNSILALVKDRFLSCAVRLGYITPNYIIQGHRQVVSTSCPGDALYKEIQSWDHFKES